MADALGLGPSSYGSASSSLARDTRIFFVGDLLTTAYMTVCGFEDKIIRGNAMEGLTYDIKKQSECVADIDIEVIPDRVNEEFEKIYGNLKKKVRIPGFRQGKAPISLIKEKYRDEARMQILNNMSEDVLEEVMKKENISR